MCPVDGVSAGQSAVSPDRASSRAQVNTGRHNCIGDHCIIHPIGAWRSGKLLSDRYCAHPSPCTFEAEDVGVAGLEMLRARAGGPGLAL